VVPGTPQRGPVDITDLVLAVSEAVTNALTHGRPPVRLRLWIARERIVATVSDPANPFAGLLPVTDIASAGLGLWFTHQLCSHVTVDTTDDQFTLRLVVGRPIQEGAPMLQTHMLPTVRDRPAPPRHEGLLAASVDHRWS
jgi:hypothetical protein